MPVAILPAGLPSTLEIRPVPMERPHPQNLAASRVIRPGLELMPSPHRAERSPLAEVDHPRRSLRPRQERSYAESPDVLILSDDEPRVNGFTNGFDMEVDSDEELPPLPSPPIKV